MSILSIPQVFEPLRPMRSKRRDFSSQTPLLHYPPPITGFKYLFQIFDSVMARRRIYREHQVSESLHSFFAVKFMFNTSLKKILEVAKVTLDTRKKITTKICRSISDFSAHLYGAREILFKKIRSKKSLLSSEIQCLKVESLENSIVISME